MGDSRYEAREHRPSRRLGHRRPGRRDSPHEQWRRRLPIGAEPVPGGGGHFRVWAPGRERVAVCLEPSAGGKGGGDVAEPIVVSLEKDDRGYFAAHVSDALAGVRYRFLLDDDSRPYPDPASRFQPEGPHGPSEVVDPDAFEWTDHAWEGPGPAPLVLYEMHVGTFTLEGTWAAARERLPHLADLGVTVLELLPVAEFPGRFGWGYDGVDLFAPYHHYGRPDEFRRFVDAAHGAGLAVILDVVYNHLGPDGNYLAAFAPQFFSRRYTTSWGDAINFSEDGCDEVRRFYRANVRHWIDEYHLDGFRIDATQNVYDEDPDHILGVLTAEARQAAGGRRTLVVGENEPQDTRLLQPPERGGYGMDLLWNDDLHHSAVVALTGRKEAYYSDHLGSAQEFVSAAKHGFLYQGQWYGWQGKRRGTPTRGLRRSALVDYLENHDQVANSERGMRLHRQAAPGAWRAMTAYLLLGPGTPMLFQGQEFASSAPFLYFAEHRGELAESVRKGRAEFLAQFRNMATDEVQRILPDPADPKTFHRSRLDWSECGRHTEALLLHRDLLRLRHDDPTFSSPDACSLDGAVLSPEAFVLRWVAPEEDGSRDRLLLVNLGRDLSFSPVPEPLLGPPLRHRWQCVWSSEDVRYGGRGTAPVETKGWNLPGMSAVVMAPVRTALAPGKGGSIDGAGGAE